MKISHLLTAAAATALLAGAAHAQTGSPGAGVTPNESMPADASRSQTGVPSVDSTRPTGGDAGATNMPGGEVNGSATGSASTGMSAGSSSSMGGSMSSSAGASMAAPAGGAAGDASATVTSSTVTNGPVADTPENRAKYRPLSNAGRKTSAKGN